MNTQNLRRRGALLALLATAALAAGPVLAVEGPMEGEQSAPPSAGTSATPERGVEWTSLSGDQRRVLSRFEGKWGELPAERQRALSRGSQKWLSMTPDERNNVKQRFRQFGEMSEDERNMVRMRWRKFQTLTPEEQDAVRRGFKRFRDLPPEAREKLRARWRQIPVEKRRDIIRQMRERRRARALNP